MAVTALRVRVACGAILCGMAIASVGAAAPERYPPLLPKAASPVLPLTILPAIAGKQPFGSRLVGVSVTPASAIVTGLDVTTLDATTRRFVGQPITEGLIRDIETTLNKSLARSEQPLLAHWLPDDAGASGILHFELRPVTVGDIRVTGATPAEATMLKRRLGVTSGAVIDSRQLAFDLAILNRYPFRKVTARLTPNVTGHGDDLAVDVIHSKPWQAYVGFKYAGSDRLTWRRYYAGGSIGGLLGRDSVLAFQATGSPDVALHGAREPNFGDAYATYTLPVTRHGLLEASLEGDKFRFAYASHSYRIMDALGAVGYRLSLPAAVGQRDIRAGIEARHERTFVTSTAGGATRQSAIEVYQLYAGYHAAHDRSDGHDDIDMVVHLSPGGLNSGSSSRNYTEYSDGRAKTARYAYLLAAYEGNGRLGTHLTWHSQASVQVSSAALPFTEQSPIGGLAYVRGYKLFDGSVDNAAILRQEVGLYRKAGLAPYLFVDAGWGRDIGARRSMVLGAVGMGVTLPLTGDSSLHFDAVHTLRDGDVTPGGTNVLEANLAFRY